VHISNAIVVGNGYFRPGQNLIPLGEDRSVAGDGDAQSVWFGPFYKRTGFSGMQAETERGHIY
jgi:hypothetical protein